MDQFDLALPAPVRALATDDPEAILLFAADAADRGGAAIATLVEIRGGAARALGAHVAVSSDGSFCGYVSGGCVEAAVATEALAAIAKGRDRIVRYGEGSPYFDIVLPCGGGITVAIHVLADAGALRATINYLRHRRSTSLRYLPDQQSLDLGPVVPKAGWSQDEFVTVYHPRSRLVISGNPLEAQAVEALARTSGYDVVRWEGPTTDFDEMIDEWTAVVILHHDLDAEEEVLRSALRSRAFYIGALGSTRTHRRREERLQAFGWKRFEIERIKAPIGFFGPTRDASSLALSVLADVAATRLSVHL